MRDQVPRLLTAREVADAFGVKPWTIYQWALDKRLPSVKIGKAVRFRPDDVVRIVAEGLPGVPPARNAAKRRAIV